MGRRDRKSSSSRRIAAIVAAGLAILAMASSGSPPAPVRGDRPSPSEVPNTARVAAPKSNYVSTEFAEAVASAERPRRRDVRPTQVPLNELLAQPGHRASVGPKGEVAVNVCSDAQPLGYAHCNAHVRTDPKGAAPRAAAEAAPAADIGNSGAYDPPYLRSAYNAPSATAGSGQTVAIAIAYDNPKAESDLAYYRSFFGLPPCTTANGCFRKVDQNGGTNYPAADTGWAQESALDIQMVSALCPSCKILLVEANTNYLDDLGEAVKTAVRLGANVVSNSYGAVEYNGSQLDSASYFNHPGVAVTVSSGDNGYRVEFPASSRYVTAVGGTNLIQNTNTGTRNATETAWTGAGSGCSAYEAKPVWQNDTGCSRRMVSDVSAVADPNTGVWVYSTYGTPGDEWWIFGGTSVAAPLVGAMYALAGNGTTPDMLASYPYGAPAGLNDVASGSNGSCSISYMCRAGLGYDGPTGLGTPNGTASFKPAAPTVPGAPQGLSATPGNTQVTLSWNPPASSGGSGITSYNVYRGTSSGAGTLLTSATGTSFTDTGLTNGAPYYYQVTAVNGVGESARSGEVSAVPTELSVPTAPQNVNVAQGNARLTVSWSPPADTGGSSITSYRLYRGTSPGGQGTTAYKTGLTTTSYVDTSVTNGTTYYYKVTAVNGVGEGPRSAEASAKAVKAPSQITNLVARSASSRGVQLTWTAPFNGGLPIQGYKIYRSRSSSSQSYYVTVTCSTTSCSYTDTNTTRGYRYYYRVAAYNAVGTAPLSNKSYARAT